MVQCIFRHVGSISRDFVDLKSRAIEPTRHVIWVLTHPRPGAASLVEPLLLTPRECECAPGGRPVRRRPADSQDAYS
jgi:hypothetical protein